VNASLPIDDEIDAIRALLDAHRAVVIVGPPGCGKTTRVPPALADRGSVFLLQPRRVAARSLARRIAEEQGWTLGQEVGWQVRFERRFSARTRLLVATEGVLTARLQSDPFLSAFRTVVLDEFHERSIHADLGLALLRQALFARDDLRVVVMSATLDARPVAEFLGGCPVVEVAGRPHPVELSYAAGTAPHEAVREALSRPGGHVLCFLPGQSEIRDAAGRLELGGLGAVRVFPLHGSLDAREQDAALAPSDTRKVILATNVAETSLTVEGVTDVVDSGWHRLLRYDAARGIDRLETERIPRDSADQRAGRAGRTAPGRAVRLWDERERLRDRREPELMRVDLAGPLLELLAWGGDPLVFEWFERPPEHAVRAGLELLERLGALEGRRLTAVGEQLRRFPLHPRLARVLVEAGGSARAAAACAVLTEWRRPPGGVVHATASDVLTAVDRIGSAPQPVRRAAEELEALARRTLDAARAPDDEATLLRAVFAGYPDRVARRREPGSRRLLMAAGHGAVLAAESGVVEAELLVAVEVTAGVAGAGAEALVRTASGVDRAWLHPSRRDVAHRLDEASGLVRAVQREWFGAILLSERPVAADPETASALVLEHVLSRGLGPSMEGLRRRLTFAGLAVDLGELLRRACAGAVSVPDLDAFGLLPPDVRHALDRLAPERLGVPSGRTVPLDYREDGAVAAEVKLQELFGLAESPRLGPRREAVTLSLLAPNGRPVQTTKDLAGFWERTYPEVRRELRGRYPRHPWPEDPWTAVPTHRTKRRR
jgi:ATP-dependent helicase HrpB